MYERRRWRRRGKTEASQHVYPLVSCPHAKFPRRAGVLSCSFLFSLHPAAARRGVLMIGRVKLRLNGNERIAPRQLSRVVVR